MTARNPNAASWRRRWSWRLLVLLAMGRLAVISGLLALLPFRLVAGLYLGPPGPAGDGATDFPPPPLPMAVWQVGRAVERAARLLPFPVLCLPQAIAAKTILVSHGHASVLHLSAKFREGPDSVGAHAWLTWHGRVVIGGGKPPDQVELARFGDRAGHRQEERCGGGASSR